MSESHRPSSLGELLAHLAPTLASAPEPPAWPPDAFALAAAVLDRTGGYRTVVGDWPPPIRAKKPWQAWIVGVGDAWRDAIHAAERTAEARPPAVVRRWWRTVVRAADPSRRGGPMALSAVAGDRRLCRALVQLLASADAACAGVGLPGHGALYDDRLLRRARRKLDRTSRPGKATGATLCSRAVDAWRLRVLPKMHTPQGGITIRSLSHHLALCSAREVLPRWIVPHSTESMARDPRLFNVLVVPWPTEIERKQFEPVDRPRRTPRNMDPAHFSFFRFRKASDPRAVRDRLAALYDAAAAHAGTLDRPGEIDLVVLPELALTGPEHRAVQRWARDRGVLVVAGISRPGRDGGPDHNLVSFEVPLVPGISTGIEQPKHHRWQLDRSQIETYGLGGHLNPSRRWWEYSAVGDRSLYFVTLLPWLTLCVLVCEDLAQQEPVARLVRAVGPNLVIAVLMDGPQLVGRWAERYATVLADDPGSSVLSVTSLGMCRRSLPPGKPPSRVIAVWKDRGDRSWGPREIALGDGADGVLLNLLIEGAEEWTADGRSDGGGAGRPVLVGAYDVRLPPQRSARKRRTVSSSSVTRRSRA